MGLLHRNEPVTDADVRCPRCDALDWVVRVPRLGRGQEGVVCRACGLHAGPPLSAADMDEIRQEARPRERARRALAEAPFPVYVPRGLEWEPFLWDFLEDVPPRAIGAQCEAPWLSVTTELPDVTEVPAEALRAALADAMDAEPPRGGRSDAAYALEVFRQEEGIDLLTAELAVERGVLRVDRREVAAQVMRAGDAWAAYADLGEVVVVVGSERLPMSDVELVRADPVLRDRSR